MDNKAKDLQEVIRLYQDHYTWQHMTHKELADYLVPSISLNQYHIFRNKSDNVMYGFTNWAYMSNDSHKRFKETGIIEKFDWDSGKNLNKFLTHYICSFHEDPSTKHYYG